MTPTNPTSQQDLGRSQRKSEYLKMVEAWSKRHHISVRSALSIILHDGVFQGKECPEAITYRDLFDWTEGGQFATELDSELSQQEVELPPLELTKADFQIGESFALECAADCKTTLREIAHATRTKKRESQLLQALQEIERLRQAFFDNNEALKLTRERAANAESRLSQLSPQEPIEWRDISKHPPLIIGQLCWIYHPDGVCKLDGAPTVIQAAWDGHIFFGNHWGWTNMRATHYMPIEQPEPPILKSSLEPQK